MQELGTATWLPISERPYFETAATERLELKRRQRLADEGCRSDALYLLLTSWMYAFSQRKTGQRHLLHVYIPGDLICQEALTETPLTYSVAALTDATLGMIDRQSLKRLLGERPAMAYALLSSSHGFLAELARHSATVASGTAFCKVARCMVAITQRQVADWCIADDWQPLPAVPCFLTQRDIADATA